MRLFRVLFVLLLLVPVATARAEERRVALVIGNANYEHVPSLRNPHNDAKAVADRLSALGFRVLLGTDLSRRQFQNALVRFGKELETADTSLFFYAGHAVQNNNANYLIPTDALLDRNDKFAERTIVMDRIVGLMNNLTKTSIILLDACPRQSVDQRHSARRP